MRLSNQPFPPGCSLKLGSFTLDKVWNFMFSVVVGLLSMMLGLSEVWNELLTAWGWTQTEKLEGQAKIKESKGGGSFWWGKAILHLLFREYKIITLKKIGSTCWVWYEPVYRCHCKRHLISRHVTTTAKSERSQARLQLTPSAIRLMSLPACIEIQK